MIYPIADWYQPAENFVELASMGVNTIIGCPVDPTWPGPKIAAAVDAWTQSLGPTGANCFLQSSLLPLSNWWKLDLCAGILIEPDEPNGGGAQTPAQMAAIAATIRKVTSKPILIDLDGAALAFQHDDSVLAAYCACADIISTDCYFYNRGQDRPQDQNALNVARIRRLAPGKKVWYVAECNDQGLRYSGYAPNGRGPTGAELTGILAESDGISADGLCFFHDIFGIAPNGQYGWLGFGLDAISVMNKSIIKAWSATKNRPPYTPPATSLDGTEATIGGVVYVLRKKS